MRRGGTGFLRNFLAYFGPALLVSVAYFDTGNYATDISAGASYAYTMLWAVWLANIIGMVLQYLSGKIGIATGYSLPELIRIHLKKRSYVAPYWLAAEVATAMVDLAEFLGIALALFLLFKIPLLYGTFLSIIDVILILGVSHGGVRRLEYAFMLFISVVGIGYVYEIFLSNPSWSLVVSGSFVPVVDSGRIILAAGVIGATVTPHTLFLHSSLTNEKLKDSRVETKRRAMRLHRLECIAMFTFAGLVNAAILIMVAAGFNAHGIGVLTIEQTYLTLSPLFGPAAAVVFGVALLVSGLSSSTTGTLAGQAIMQGMLGRKVNVWIRRVVTRLINTIPTTIAILIGLNPLLILVYSQVALSLLLPFALLPLWKFSRDRRIMGVFTNGTVTSLLSTLFVSIILVLNFVLVYVIITGVL